MINKGKKKKNKKVNNKKKKMACFVPFNNRNLDISFFLFRPMVVVVDELVEALKHFSSCTEDLGCVHAALFRSIHGNMIIWYGAWIKRSNENKELLTATLLPMLTKVSSMAVLIDHSFFEAQDGGSRDGCPEAKFYIGDTVSMNSASISNRETNKYNDFSYACLAVFKSSFIKMEGATAGVCLNICQNHQPRVVSLFTWKSLHSCYSWILNHDYRKTLLPYLDGLSLEVKYDIFRVVYVNSDSVLNFGFYPHQKLENEVVENKGGKQILQD